MRTNQKILFVLALIILCCGLAVTQETNKKKQPGKPPNPSSAKRAVPVPSLKASAEMIKLRRQMVGAWKTSQKFESSALLPQGAINRGTAEIRPGPGGLSILQEFRAPGVAGGGGVCTAHGIIYWDEAAQAFRDLWCDAWTAGGCTLSEVGTGKWEGNKLVFNGERNVEGQKMATRTTFSFGSSMAITMEGVMKDGAMKPLMTVKFSK